MIPPIHQKDIPLYEQIYQFYKDAILHGRLKSKYKLPPYRTLAKELGIACNTVLKAYEQLILEGYVQNRERKGLYVTRVDENDWQADSVLEKKKQKKNPAVRKAKNERVHFNAAAQLVDETNFPVRQWRKCSNWALDNISFRYEEHEQHDPLKDQLVKYLFAYRGVNATPERLVIGSGASPLVFWLALILRKSCSRVVIEEPGYPRIRFAFSELGYNVKPVRVGSNGIELKALLKEKADLVYLTPSHQYPTGSAIPVSHRLQILSWARKNNAWIIEDDFDCEFRYKTKLMPSLQALDKADRVIYIGTFSSALMPSLRVGYLVLPDNFQIPYESYRYLANTVPYFTRKTLAHFMESGFWERHLKKMRNVYKRKYEACIQALKKIPAKHIQFNNTHSGLNILLRISTKLTEQQIIQRALDSGVLVTSASEFYADKANVPHQSEVLLEFGSLPEEAIQNVVEKLYTAWFPNRSILK